MAEEFERTRMQQLDAERRVLMRERVQAMEAARSRAQKEAGRMLSARVRESAAAVCRRQEEICNDVFAKVEARLVAFTKTEVYPAFLKQSAQRLLSALPVGAFCVFYAPQDAAWLEFLHDCFPEDVRFAEDAAIRLGGLRAVSANGHVLADDTLDANLAEQKRRFAETSGLNG